MSSPASASQTTIGVPENPPSPDAPLFDAADTVSIGRRIQAYLAAELATDVDIGPMTRFTVGFSWATYSFDATWRDEEASREVTRALVLRVGTPNGIFAPYKASPEFITLHALQTSGVPVPKVYWYSDGSDVIGAPFFVCERVPGSAPIPWSKAGSPAFDDARRTELGDQFVGALAALHSFTWHDTAVAGIGGTTDPNRTALDQLDYWDGRLHAWSRHRVPMMEFAAAWLRENAPVADRVTLVHGDYRIGNFLADKGAITAILDWELVHLGDPVEDLGWVCLHAWRGRSDYMCHFLTREELRDRYAALTGHDVDLAAIRYWEAFGTYKLAVMHYGAAFCFEERGFNDLRMAGMGAQIPRMLSQVDQAVERAS